MNQGKSSSFLPIFYILTVVVSISIIQVTEMIAEQNHREEMKKAGKVNKKFSSSKRKKESTAKSKKKKVQKDDLAKDTTLLQAPKDSVVEVADVMSDETYFKNLSESYQAKRTNDKRSRSSRTDLVIRYYKKQKDGDEVYKLRDLGFYIHERPAEQDFDDYASNAIFYGDSVKKEDLMMIAYQLIDNGLKLQSITLSKFHDTWKAHSVEIGTDTTALNQPIFSSASLREQWGDK